MPISRKSGLALVGALCLLALVLCAPPAARAQEPISFERAEQLLARSRASYAKVKDYTAVFYRLVADKGQLLPHSTMLIKYMKPGLVYLKSLAGESKDREILFNPLKDKTRLWVHNGSFPKVTVCLDPKGGLATDCVGRTIHDTGFGFIMDMMDSTLQRARQNPDDKVKLLDLGTREVYGRPADCIAVEMPQSATNDYYGRRARVCFDQKTGLPYKVTIWDQEDRLREDYGYADVKLNVGLGPKDFDPENPAYHF